MTDTGITEPEITEAEITSAEATDAASTTDPTHAPATRRHPRDVCAGLLGGEERLWRLSITAVFVVQAAMLLWVGRNQWYFFDEWRLIVERIAAPGDVSRFERLFRPDGEHVIALPLGVFIVLTSLGGLASYWPLVFANVLVRLATLWLVDDIVRRLGGRRLTRLVVLTSIALFGGGFESLFGQSLIFAGLTLVFTLLAFREVVSVGRSDVRVAVVATTFLTLAVFSTSYGFPAVLGVTLFLMLTDRWRASIATLVVPPLAFLLVRRLAGGSYSDQVPISLDRTNLYVDYIQAGLSALGEAMTGLEGLGLASFVGLVVLSVVLASDRRQRVFIAAITLSVLAFYGQASLSRSALGAEQAGSTRYIFFCGVLTFAMVGAAWSQRRSSGKEAAIVAILLVVSLGNSIGRLVDGQQFFIPKMELSRARLAVGFVAVDRGVGELIPDPDWAPDLSAGRLESVVAWSGTDRFLEVAERCYDGRLEELGELVDVDALSVREQAALVLLVNENSLGFGAPDSSLTSLIEWGASGATGSLVLAQFQSDYDQFLTVGVGLPDDASAVVVPLQRCA